MSAVARNIDFVGASEEAPASGFAWVAVRVRIICCYASAIPQPICEALAELFSCRPHRAPIVYSTLRYFPPPKSRIKHPRACGSSARRSLADASVSHCRTVVRPLQRMRLERDADDNRTALITPSNARFTDLGMLASRLTFIQQRSYDRRCRTSHSCQIQTFRPHRASNRLDGSRSESGKPARHIGAIAFILGSVALAERRLLIGNYDNVKKEPDQRAVAEEMPVSE
jgi:hypothetical protein